MKKTHGTGIRFLILALLFALVFFGSFWVGRYDVSPLQTLRILADWLLRTLSRGNLALMQTWQVRAQAVVLNVRLPRVAAAALVGAALSTAGCAYQGMFRNPMSRRTFLARRPARALARHWRFCWVLAMAR